MIFASSASIRDNVPACPVPIPIVVFPLGAIVSVLVPVSAAFNARLLSVVSVRVLAPIVWAPAIVIKPDPFRIVRLSFHILAPTLTAWLDVANPKVSEDHPLVIFASSASIRDNVPACPVPMPMLVFPFGEITKAPVPVKVPPIFRFESVKRESALAPIAWFPLIFMVPDPVLRVRGSCHVYATTFIAAVDVVRPKVRDDHPLTIRFNSAVAR